MAVLLDPSDTSVDPGDTAREKLEGGGVILPPDPPQDVSALSAQTAHPSKA